MSESAPRIVTPDHDARTSALQTGSWWRRPRLPRRRPRLGIVGPMFGRRPGSITTQGVILTDHFRSAGYEVTSVSESPNRYLRLADVLATLARRRREIDVLIVETYSGPSFVVQDAATMLARAFGWPIVLHLHGGGLPAFTARFPRWSRRVFGRAHAAVAPSAFLADLASRHGVPARVIPNIVDLPSYPFRHRPSVRPRLLWMRTFHPLYNPGMALRVLARLRGEHADATLVMAGRDDGLEAEVRRDAAAIGLGEAVRFPRFLDHAGKCREGEAADVFVNTNRVDNTPVAVLEACAMGLPVVSTDVGGMPAMLQDGETGLLVGTDDDDAMADAILRLVRTPALAARLSAAGPRVARQAAWESVLPAYEALFDELLAGGGSV